LSSTTSYNILPHLFIL